MTSNPTLPVPVLEHPHWRLVYRPSDYNPDSIPTLNELWQIAEKHQVRLRGWNFPHLGRANEERGAGDSWIASWSSFMGHLEYWRLFQSAQFLYLSSVREHTETSWARKLRQEFHVPRNSTIAVDDIPGFISIKNFIYTVTEFFEFASRLCQAELYRGSLEITLELHGIRGFALTTSPEHAWFTLHQASADKLGKEWRFSTSEIVAEPSVQSLRVIIWFFERFGWTDIRPEVVKHDQDNFLAGRS